MKSLTKKQSDFYEKLTNLYGNEPFPSFDKICSDTGLKSKNSVWQYFTKFLELELIKEKANRFFIPFENIGIPYFEKGVSAGFTSLGDDYLQEKLSFDDLLVKNPNSTYSVRVFGDSMIDAGIYEDDIAIVEKNSNPRSGDIVIAQVDGEFTIKYFYQKGAKAFLEPANKKYSTIYPENELNIFGVVTGIVRKFH